MIVRFAWRGPSLPQVKVREDGSAGSAAVRYLQWQLMERGRGRHFGEQIGRRREEIELQPRLAASLGRAGEREDASRTAGPDFCQGR